MESKMQNRNRKAECDVCNMLMRSDNLKRHKQTHRDLLSLPDNEFKNELETRQDIKKRQEEKNENIAKENNLAIPDKITSRKREPATKMERQGENECRECGTSFDTSSKLIAHLNGAKGVPCKPKACKNCGCTFAAHRYLLAHEKRSKKFTCTHCSKVFCTNDHFQKHLRSIKSPVNKDDYLPVLVTAIAPASGYEEYPGYQSILDENAELIEDRRYTSSVSLIINKRIGTNYTYGELLALIHNVYSQQKSAFKINLGFGYVLYHTVEEYFQYHYNSSNSLLFENAITIKNQDDVIKFLKKVIDLDLQTTYFLRKPSSAFVLAGLTNVEIEITPLKDVPIG